MRPGPAAWSTDNETYRGPATNPAGKGARVDPIADRRVPTKAKTLARFLGSEYRIEASIGHIRDLPSKAAEVPKEIKSEKWGRMAVDVDHDFEPHYIVPADKSSIVPHTEVRRRPRRRRSSSRPTPTVRGRRSSWHILELISGEVKKGKIPVRRIVFHELTKEAVLEGIAQAHEIDRDLVDAQEGRRILDRLYGYEVSPVLWRRIAQGLSAGRVQSVAVRLLVEREEERRRFRKAFLLGHRGQAVGRRPGVRGDARPGGRQAGRHREGFRPRDRRVAA